MANNKPLVTIGVLAYNSANTILETLDSIASQTYDNIELIICDDGSMDNTLVVVKTWLDEHTSFLDITKIVSATLLDETYTIPDNLKPFKMDKEKEDSYDAIDMVISAEQAANPQLSIDEVKEKIQNLLAETDR